MLKAILFTVPLSQCNQQYLDYGREAKHITLENGVKKSQYCAWDPNERRDICDGDSGMSIA